jgi:hypothetical protein
LAHRYLPTAELPKEMMSYANGWYSVAAYLHVQQASTNPNSGYFYPGSTLEILGGKDGDW